MVKIIHSFNINCLDNRGAHIFGVQIRDILLYLIIKCVCVYVCMYVEDGVDPF